MSTCLFNDFLCRNVPLVCKHVLHFVSSRKKCLRNTQVSDGLDARLVRKYRFEASLVSSIGHLGTPSTLEGKFVRLRGRMTWIRHCRPFSSNIHMRLNIFVVLRKQVIRDVKSKFIPSTFHSSLSYVPHHLNSTFIIPVVCAILNKIF